LKTWQVLAGFAAVFAAGAWYLKRTPAASSSSAPATTPATAATKRAVLVNSQTAAPATAVVNGR
jgi:hypothetical protein